MCVIMRRTRTPLVLLRPQDGVRVHTPYTIEQVIFAQVQRPRRWRADGADAANGDARPPRLLK